MIEVREISSRETWTLRWKVLRPHLLAAEDCVFPGDDDPGTFHLGAFLDGRIACIGTFKQETTPDFPEAIKPYRLRGMATEPTDHRKGLGKALILAAEKKLRKEGSHFLWFNAREIAFPFYQSLGYEFKGDLFDIPEAGPHKVMFKFL